MLTFIKAPAQLDPASIHVRVTNYISNKDSVRLRFLVRDIFSVIDSKNLKYSDVKQDLKILARLFFDLGDTAISLKITEYDIIEELQHKDLFNRNLIYSLSNAITVLESIDSIKANYYLNLFNNRLRDIANAVTNPSTKTDTIIAVYFEMFILHCENDNLQPYQESLEILIQLFKYLDRETLGVYLGRLYMAARETKNKINKKIINSFLFETKDYIEYLSSEEDGQLYILICLEYFATYRNESKDKQALQFFPKLVALWRHSQKDTALLAALFNNWGKSYIDLYEENYERSNLNEGLRYLDSSVFFWSKEPIGMERVRALNNYNDALIYKGELHKSLAIASQALEYKKTLFGSTSPDYIMSLVRLAESQYNIGQLKEAEITLRKGIILLDSIDIAEFFNRNSIGTISSLFDYMALIFSDLNNYDSASKYYRLASEKIDALSGLPMGENSEDINESRAYNYHNIAYTSFTQFKITKNKKYYDQADYFYSKALNIRDRVDRFSLKHLATILNYSDLYINEDERGLKLQKLKLVERLRDSLYKSPFHLGGLNQRLFQYYFEINRFDSAEYYALKALENESMQNLKNLIYFYVKSKKYDKAVPYIERLYNNTISALNNSMFLAESEKIETLQSLYEVHYYILTVAIHSQNESLTNYAFKMQNVTKTLILNLSKEVNRKTNILKDHEISTILERRSYIKAHLNTRLAESFQNENDQNNDLKNELINLERILNEKIDLRIDYSAFEFDKIDSFLNINGVLIEIYELPHEDSVHKLGAFIYKKGMRSPRLINFILHDSIYDSLYDAIEKPIFENTHPGVLWLSQVFWKEIKQFVPGSKTLFIIPDGIFTALPFETILVSNGVYLFDQYNVHYLTSLNSFEDCFGSQTIMPKSALIFGGIDYGNISDTAKLYWPPLAGASKECNVINEMLIKSNFATTLFKGTIATKRQFLSSILKPYSIIHIATHGFNEIIREENTNENIKKGYDLLRESMLGSGLVFANANKSGNRIRKIDSTALLSALEISNFNLNDTKLVVMSACSSGLGELDTYEGIMGLRRALKIAGVKNLLLALWEIPDKISAQFVTEFYKNLASGLEIRNSFLKAMKFMKDLYPDNPGVWAGFILIN